LERKKKHSQKKTQTEKQYLERKKKMDNFETKTEIYSEGEKETKWKTIFIEKEK
jgi:hypothetical protein